MDDNCAILGQTVLKLRRMFHVSQETLADFLGCSINTISNWEHGRSYPQSYYLPMIADRFHVSIDYLFGRER